MRWHFLALVSLLPTAWAQSQSTLVTSSTSSASSTSGTSTTSLPSSSSSAAALGNNAALQSSSATSPTSLTQTSSSTSSPTVTLSSASPSSAVSATVSSASSTPTYPPLSGKTLRILGLGDSITHGYGSSTGNGYRYKLMQLLSANSNNVTLVGGVQSGNVSTPFAEGHDGAYISDVSSWANSSALPRRPNVVLLHAGTNDMLFQMATADAPSRLSSIIDQIFQICTDATVLVAQIIPTSDGATNNRTQVYNQAVAGVVSTQVGKGRQVVLVDHYTPFANSSTYLFDGVHPNDAGYDVMGQTWYYGLQKAAANGWLGSTPMAMTNLAPVYKRETCASNPVWQFTNWILPSPGLGSSKQTGVNCTAASNTTCLCTYFDGTNRTLPMTGSSCSLMSTSYFNNVQFADLNNDGISDYLFIRPDASVYVATSTGSGWTPTNTFACCTGARPEEITFADLNGDGRADYIWIHPDGTIEAWLNTANYGWIYLGIVMAAKAGMPGAGIRFADLDGDGLADWLYIDPLNNGQVTAFKNGGSSCNFFCQGAMTWKSLGVLLGSSGTRDSQLWADLNGDGFADYLQIDRNSGALSVSWNWFNTAWASGQYIFWPGGQVATGFYNGFDASQIQFADTTGDGRAEYLYVERGGGAVFQILNWC